MQKKKLATPADKIDFIDTPPFKLKDKQGRGYQAINLMKQFGFVPDVIVVEKFPGRNNLIRVRAVKKVIQESN